jgi:hypothetical protein
VTHYKEKEMKTYRRKVQTITRALHYDGSKQSYLQCKSVMGDDGFKYEPGGSAPWVYFYGIAIMPDAWFVSDPEMQNGTWIVFTPEQFASMYEEHENVG